MATSYMPQDLRSAEDSPGAGTRLPAKPKSRGEPWEYARSAAFSDPSNVAKWDHLFRALDDAWTPAAPEGNEPLKAAAAAAYSAFLSRFPYSAHYWKQYSALQFKLSGLEQSLACLKSAVAACPQSVSLWVDYLTGVQALRKEREKPESAKTAAAEDVSAQEDEKSGSPISDEHIRKEFSRGAAAVGWNFNSDPFWDKYIDFENQLSPENPTAHLLAVYKQLICIPLYQYAQYYNQFLEVGKAFPVDEVLPADVLAKYLAPYGKQTPEQLSVLEKHQIIDTYCYDVFSNTQKRVSEKWPFESLLTVQDYSHSSAVVDAQLPEWLKYLDHEITSYEKTKESSPEEYKGVVNLFERALVPNCARASLWLKYTSFLRDHSDHALEAQKEVFQRAISHFVPVDDHSIRDTYVSVLLEAKRFDEATDFLLSTSQLYSGSTGSRIYVKAAYMHDLSALLTAWSQNIEAWELSAALEPLATTYFDRVDRYTKEAPKETTTETKGSHTLKKELVSLLTRITNNDGISVVAVKYLQALQKCNQVEKIRSYFNKFHTESVFSHSVQFWRFFVDFESRHRRNLKNLKAVVDYIKTASALPKKAVDAFLDIYYEYTCANLHSAVALSAKDNYLDILVNIGAEKSDDLSVNKAARSRLAANNYFIHDMRLNSPLAMESHLMAMAAKHAAHPGIITETVPELTNSTMGKEWISLLDDEAPTFAAPNFRNLDKASAPVNYPDE